MSAVLLSNWFPIRAYDSADPRLSYTRVYSSTRELALLEACSFFCFPPLSLFFSFSYFSFFFFPVLRFGSSRWSIKRSIDPPPLPRSASLVRNHSRREGGGEGQSVTSLKVGYHREFSGSTILSRPPLRDLSEPTWDWISSRRIRVNDRR